MKQFAMLDEQDFVQQVILIDSAQCLDENGNFSEEKGIEQCKLLYGENSKWAFSDPTGVFRKNYALSNYRFDRKLNAFIPPQPFANWSFNTETLEWDSPIPRPGPNYEWNHETNQWVNFINDDYEVE